VGEVVGSYMKLWFSGRGDTGCLARRGNLAAHPPVPLLSATCFYALDGLGFSVSRAGLHGAENLIST
jgi:hypothetical protein